MQECLLMFSGGRDSFLSCCLLLEAGIDKVRLVTFDNGCMQGADHAEITARRLVEKYRFRAAFQGVESTTHLWRELKSGFLNLKPSEVVSRWGEITCSQFNCMSCRIAMYVRSVQICRELGIGAIAIGTRPSQGFAVEQSGSVTLIAKFLEGHDIKLLTPVMHFDSDWRLKNELIVRGFVPKMLEPQCLIGYPLPRNGLSNDEFVACERCLETLLLPMADDLVGAFGHGSVPDSEKIRI